MKMTLITFLIILNLVGCTENDKAKYFGGTMKVDLPPSTKLVNVTWKESEMWYLTRPARAGEVPETLTFQEKSSMGVWEGTVIFTEH